VNQREKFEAWFKARWPEFEHPTTSAFEVWQESRRTALEECWEAVHGERLEDPTETHGDMAYERAIGDCENAIRLLITEGDKQ